MSLRCECNVIRNVIAALNSILLSWLGLIPRGRPRPQSSSPSNATIFRSGSVLGRMRGPCGGESRSHQDQVLDWDPGVLYIPEISYSKIQFSFQDCRGQCATNRHSAHWSWPGISQTNTHAHTQLNINRREGWAGVEEDDPRRGRRVKQNQ